MNGAVMAERQAATFGEWLKSAMAERKVGVRHTAQYAALSPSAVTNLLKGTTQPKLETIFKLAEYFPADPDALIALARLTGPAKPASAGSAPVPSTWADEVADRILMRLREREQAIYAVPVSGIASAGPGGLQDDYGYVPKAQVRPELRMLAVTGDCMVPEIRPGDVAIIDTEASYRPGSTVAATRGDRVIVKRFHNDELRGDNGSVERAADWTIVGVVVGFQRGLRRPAS